MVIPTINWLVKIIARTTLELYKGKYYVANINYLDRSIWIVDPGLKKGKLFLISSLLLDLSKFQPWRSIFFAHKMGISFYGFLELYSANQ